MKELKNEQRRSVKNALLKVSNSKFDHWNISISENISKFLSGSENKVVGGYAPILHEPIWYLSLIGDFKLAFPAYEKCMVFKISKIENLVKKSDFGVEILSPVDSAVKVEPDILLIPGISFTLNGERLGRGKGFYDRYLENFSGLKVGVCYQCQVRESLATLPHDQKMEYLVTEENIYRIRS
jgi:5-formyltetrahydrofolate cyclo-ligase